MGLKEENLEPQEMISIRIL